MKIALVNYLSTGDFFQAYEAGAQKQAKALGIDLRIDEGRQDAAEQREQIQQAISLGVSAIIVNHGLPESLSKARKADRQPTSIRFKRRG